LIEPATKSGDEPLAISQCGQQGNAAPGQHGKVPIAELELLKNPAVREQNASQAGDRCYARLGDEVDGRQTDSDDPVGEESVRGRKGGGRQHRPAANEIDQHRDAHRTTPKEIQAYWDPCEERYPRRNHEAFLEVMRELNSSWVFRLS
jgi:hypothetical protein